MSYTFRIVKFKTEDSYRISKQELVIEVIGSSKLYLTISLSNYFDIKEIRFMNHGNDYFVGYFGLQTSIENALSDLSAKHYRSENMTFLSLEWECFSQLFRDWLSDKMMPLMKKEFELSQLIFEE
jgi:hypothetical protein